jgi:hypothetical protein
VAAETHRFEWPGGPVWTWFGSPFPFPGRALSEGTVTTGGGTVVTGGVGAGAVATGVVVVVGGGVARGVVVVVVVVVGVTGAGLPGFGAGGFGVTRFFGCGVDRFGFGCGARAGSEGVVAVGRMMIVGWIAGRTATFFAGTLGG